MRQETLTPVLIGLLLAATLCVPAQAQPSPVGAPVSYCGSKHGIRTWVQPSESCTKGNPLVQRTPHQGAGCVCGRGTPFV